MDFGAGEKKHSTKRRYEWAERGKQMRKAMTEGRLARETRAYRGRGGVSTENRTYGFHPAFRDDRTGAVCASRFADGRPAPFHLLDGLPEEFVLTRNAAG